MFMMKTLNVKALAIRSLMLMFLSTALFSFSTHPGGDSYTIYLNDKLLIQHYVHGGSSMKPLTLTNAQAGDVLKVHYSHCGKMGISRALTIKDNSEKSLKSWKYADSPDGSASPMTCKVGDLVALQKSNPSRKMNLYYVSEQLPDGKMLAPIQLSDDTKASVK